MEPKSKPKDTMLSHGVTLSLKEAANPHHLEAVANKCLAFVLEKLTDY